MINVNFGSLNIEYKVLLFDPLVNNADLALSLRWCVTGERIF